MLSGFGESSMVVGGWLELKVLGAIGLWFSWRSSNGWVVISVVPFLSGANGSQEWCELGNKNNREKKW